MKIRFRDIVFAIFLLWLLDQAAVYWADRIILARDADFEEHFSRATLSFDRNPFGTIGKTECEFKYVLLIYGYQTCFAPAGSQKTGQAGYDFWYNSPRPKLAIFFRGDSPNDYYFIQFNAGGTALKHVTREREIEKISPPNF